MKQKHRYYFANLLSACADQYERTIDPETRNRVRVSPSRRRRIKKLEKYASRALIGK